MAMRSIEQLTEEALALPSESRLLLIEKLLESFAESDPAIEAAWLDLAKRRRDEIRSGQMQAIEVMQTLVDRWQQTHHPHTCPHGCPIYLSLEESSLSKFFRRHWVIDKSHGI